MPTPKQTQRRNLETILVSYLESRSSMRFHSTPAQIRAAAKKIADSGRLPSPVAAALHLKEAA